MREQFNPFLNFDFLLDDIPIVYLFNEKIRKSKKIFTVCLFLSKCIITPIGLFFSQNS